MNVTPIIFIFFIFCDDRSFIVVWSRTIQADNVHFNDVLCVPSVSYNLLSVYKITHSCEGKKVKM